MSVRRSGRGGATTWGIGEDAGIDPLLALPTDGQGRGGGPCAINDAGVNVFLGSTWNGDVVVNRLGRCTRLACGVMIRERRTSEISCGHTLSTLKADESADFKGDS